MICGGQGHALLLFLPDDFNRAFRCGIKIVMNSSRWWTQRPGYGTASKVPSHEAPTIARSTFFWIDRTSALYTTTEGVDAILGLLEDYDAYLRRDS